MQLPPLATCEHFPALVESFAQRLQSEIDRIGKSKAWVGRRLHGVPASTLGYWLRGETEPPPYTQGLVLEALAAAPSKIREHPAIRSLRRDNRRDLG